jgi:hypothetical protein
MQFYSAPVAQWIERCPPEAEACVRVAAGVLTINRRLAVDCLRVSEGNSRDMPRIDPERFLSMIRFDTRQKLDDLPYLQLDS